MSLVALSIDALLPSLSEIGKSLNVVNSKDNQLLITMIFLGIGFGQLVFGPISDSLGRKPVVYIGFSIFIIASFICIFTKSFEMMVVGRMLQGFGLSAPRSLTMSMIRDSYSGNYMAKIMSIVTMFFILIPVIAPTLGAFLTKFYHWHSIFYFNLIFGIIIIIWFWKRQPETLKKSKRISLKPSLFTNGISAFFKQKEAVAYTFVSGFITGSFMVYLSTSEHVFTKQYKMGEMYPYIFASLAISVGIATFFNSQLVEKYGMFRIAFTAAIAYTLTSLLYVFLFWNSSNPSIYVLVSFFAVQFFAVGFLFGNLRALAMQPLGHIAGIGAAINGFISTVLAVPIANYIGDFVDKSVLPLFIGFSIFGILSTSIFFLMRKINTIH